MNAKKVRSDGPAKRRIFYRRIIMSQARTYGRRPTLGEAKEYYARQDVLEFLSYACKKRKVFFSFKAEPSA